MKSGVRGSDAMLPAFDSRRRATIIASFLVLTTVLAVLGMFPWQPPAILLVWLGLIKATEMLLSRQTSARTIRRIATVAFCADALLVSACVFFIGGALWIGAAFYLFLVMVAASMLPLQNALWVAGVAIASFAFITMAEVSGEIVRPAFFEIPDYAGDYRLGVTTILLAATTMALALVVQQALVAEIRRSEHSYRLVLEAASDMIITLDEDGRVVRANAAVAEQTGYTLDYLAGTAIAELLPTAERAAFERQLGFVRLGSRVPFEVSYVHKSGSQRWVAGTVTPIPETGGEARMLLIARDVTQAKLAERERERLRNELAQALRIQALGRLVSGVAHELNNPLTTILTTADDLLDAKALDPDDRESLAIVRQQAHRARATVRDMVAFVRAGSERKVERILPSTALADVLATAKPEVEAAGARLQTDIALSMAPVEIDRAGLDQVVTNIVMNAAQAAGDGGLVTVRARTADRFCEVVVEDTGPGIASDALAHIFEPFYTTKKVGEGTGLGLSLSLGIVQHYGGTITAENRSYSAEGSTGARVTIRLPIAADANLPAADGASAAAKQARRIAESPTAPAPARTVLVVDDEDSIRRALRRYLERLGWTVEDVPGAIEALPLITAEGAADRYAAIICDIKMPHMTGLELCARLRTEAPHMIARLILTSGDMSLDERELRDCEAGGTLSKPYDVGDLRALVDSIAAGVART